MSSILKALRRLEEDRARKSQSAPEIAASLLRGDRFRRRRNLLWLWPTAVIIFSLAAGTFFWRGRPQAVQNTAEEHGEPSAMVNPPLQVRPVTRPAEIIVEEVIDGRRPVVAAPSPAPIVEKNVTAPPLPAVKAVPVPVPVQRGVAAASPVKIEERTTPAVSVIAWQEESSERMAVIDGLPVMTGEMVGKARVQEIMKETVLFNEDGTLFRVRLQSP